MRHAADISRTASSGYLPLAVSPLSMTQSAPSVTALPTSLISARVGRGLTIMLSSIWVAQMTGLPAMLHRAMSFFWAAKTSAAGISIPRSPRATMTPSVASRISLKLLRPWRFSILAMIWMFLPSGPRTSRIEWMSAAERIKLWKERSASGAHDTKSKGR